jgi:CheY-specific phosphatase CheX
MQTSDSKNDFFSGSFFVSFPEKAYLNLRKQVLGETETTINDNNSDFAGELANIIYGQTKKELHENGINLEMVIPTSDRSASLKSKHPIIIIPIDSSFGRFYIKLAKDLY